MIFGTCSKPLSLRSAVQNSLVILCPLSFNILGCFQNLPQLFHSSLVGQKSNPPSQLGTHHIQPLQPVVFDLTLSTCFFLPLCFFEIRSSTEPRVGKPQLGYSHQGAACCWSGAAAAMLFSFRRLWSLTGRIPVHAHSQAAYSGSHSRSRKRRLNIRKRLEQKYVTDTALYKQLHEKYECLPLPGPSFSLFAGLTVHLCPCLCPSVSQCPEENVRPPHMRALNKAVAAAFNSPGDDNCGLRDGLLVKATAVRAYFSAVIAAR